MIFKIYLFASKVPLSKRSREWKAQDDIAIRIERYSRILLPLTFGTFCLVFGIVVLKYRVSEDYQQEEWQEMVASTK